MQLAPNQLSNHLQRGLKSLYTLHGDEPLLQQEALDAIRAVARAQGYTERTSHTVAGAHFDWSEVLASGGSLSLFADKQIVEIRIPSGKPGKDGSVALQQLAEAAQGNDSTLTIVMLPRMDKTSKSTAWFMALENCGVSIEVQPVERNALPQWIAQRLAAQGQRVAAGEAGQRTLQFFADKVEGNLLAAHQEIQKLGLLFPVAANAGELSFEQVESAVLNVARYDVFKLSEAVLAGQSVRVQRMLDGLQAIEHTLHAQGLSGKHRLREFEHVVACHVQYRVFDLGKRQYAARASYCICRKEQVQFLDLLVCRQQVALYSVGKKLQRALAFFTRINPLALHAQALGNPGGQRAALHRLNLQRNAKTLQCRKPRAGLGHLVQARQHHDGQQRIVVLRGLRQLLQCHAAVFAGLATGDANFDNLLVRKQTQAAARSQHLAPVKMRPGYGVRDAFGITLRPRLHADGV